MAQVSLPEQYCLVGGGRCKPHEEWHVGIIAHDAVELYAALFLAGNRIASCPFEYRGEQRYGGGINHMQQPEPLLRTAVRDIGQEICVQAIEHGVDIPEERCAAPVVGV